MSKFATSLWHYSLKAKNFGIIINILPIFKVVYVYKFKMQQFQVHF
jgi:hypothetical protein